MSHPELVEPVAERLEPLGSGEVLDTVQGWADQDERVAWRIGLAMLYAELGESDLARETIAPVVESDV